MKNKRILTPLIIVVAIFTLMMGGCMGSDSAVVEAEPTENTSVFLAVSVAEVPEFKGEPYCVLNNNIPDLSTEDADKTYFENYGPLDNLGRCGVAFACLGTETMPTEERGEIGQVKPSGWKTAKYDCVDGKYLYNRCHLVGFQLSGENANERNLITGTRYMNVQIGRASCRERV